MGTSVSQPHWLTALLKSGGKLAFLLGNHQVPVTLGIFPGAIHILQGRILWLYAWKRMSNSQCQSMWPNRVWRICCPLCGLVHRSVLSVQSLYLITLGLQHPCQKSDYSGRGAITLLCKVQKGEGGGVPTLYSDFQLILLPSALQYTTILKIF